MIKKAFVLFLTIIILVSIPFSAAFAESYSSTGWTATFTGDGISSNFNSNTVASEISRIEPGDDIIVSVTLKNNDSVVTDWYMTNEILQSLEDSIHKRAGGAYDYELIYEGPDGTKTFFNSSGIGGDNGDVKQATGNLKDYFFVGTLKTGATGKVTLKVAIDGEADGNSYQDAMAQFKMVFAVEKTTNDGTKKEYSPKTGEILRIGLWLVVFLASIAIIVVLIKAKKNARKDDESENETRS